MKRFLSIILTTLILILCVGCNKKDKNKNTDKSFIDNDATVATAPKEGYVVQTSNGVISGKVTGDSSKNSDTAKNNSSAKVGQSISSEKWKIECVSAKQYQSIDDDFFSQKPEDGNVFVVVLLEATNISDKDDFINTFNMDSYVDGQKHDTKQFINDVEGNKPFSGDVKAGEKLDGYVAYEVSKSWNEIDITYNNSIISQKGSNMTFKISRYDLTE